MGLDALSVAEKNREARRRKGEKESPSLSRVFREAGLTGDEERGAKRRLTLLFTLSVLSFYLTKSPLIFGICLLLLSLEPLRVMKRRRARAQNFDRDFAAFLLSLASSVRTGLDPLSALTLSADMFSEDSELRIQIHEVKKALDRGESEERAIRAFGAHIAHPDITLFTTALILSRKEGASIGDTLQRLSKVTRQRQSFRRKIKTALAMQKLSAFGIALSAIALTLIQGATNPEAVRTAFMHPVGSKAMLLGCFFMVLGLFWMARMARARV